LTGAPAARAHRSVWQRTVTAALALLVFVAALFLLPAPGWAALVALACALAGLEWGRLSGLRGAPLAGYGLLLGCSPLLLLADGASGSAALWLSLAFWVVVAPVLLALGTAVPARPLALAAAGWLVIAPAGYALGTLQVDPVGLLAVMAVIWMADTGAYFTGRRYGRRKLAPVISPSKTWEGVAGGMLGVWVYIAVLNGAGAAPELLRGLPGLGVATLLALMSIEGDLFESWIKRRAGVKDSGTLLPGHGGVLDRVDGLMPTLPLAALLVAWAQR
jgi:phosphatidate cytidylyltransferase